MRKLLHSISWRNPGEYKAWRAIMIAVHGVTQIERCIPRESGDCLVGGVGI